MTLAARTPRLARLSAPQREDSVCTGDTWHASDCRVTE